MKRLLISLSIALLCTVAFGQDADYGSKLRGNIYIVKGSDTIWIQQDGDYAKFYATDTLYFGDIARFAAQAYGITASASDSSTLLATTAFVMQNAGSGGGGSGVVVTAGDANKYYTNNGSSAYWSDTIKSNRTYQDNIKNYYGTDKDLLTYFNSLGYFRTKDASSGGSAGIKLFSGDALPGGGTNSGSMSLYSGDAQGTSGNINIYTGAAGVQGNIYLGSYDQGSSWTSNAMVETRSASDSSNIIASTEYVDNAVAAGLISPSTFLDLTDVPGTYAGSANYFARVTSDADSLVFFDINSVGALSTVAYKGQNNAFTTSQTITGDLFLATGDNRFIGFTGLETIANGLEVSAQDGNGGNGGDLTLTAGDDVGGTGGNTYIHGGGGVVNGALYLGSDTLGLYYGGVYTEDVANGDSTLLVATTAFVDRAIDLIDTTNIARTDASNTFVPNQIFSTDILMDGTDPQIMLTADTGEHLYIIGDNHGASGTAGDVYIYAGTSLGTDGQVWLGYSDQGSTHVTDVYAKTQSAKDSSNIVATTQYVDKAVQVGGGGGGGVTDFISLTDVPGSYASEAYKFPQVNAGETALEFSWVYEVKTDNVSGAATDSVSMHSGNVTSGAFASGDVNIFSGNTAAGTSGSIYLFPGNGTTDGDIYLGSWDGTNYRGIAYSNTVALNDSTKTIATTAFVDRALATTPGAVGGTDEEFLFNNAGVSDGVPSMTWDGTDINIANSTDLNIGSEMTIWASPSISEVVVQFDSIMSIQGVGSATDLVTFYNVGDTIRLLADTYATTQTLNDSTDLLATTGFVDRAIAAQSPVSTFTGLTDAPNSYSGQSLKAVRVNAGESAVEFVDYNVLGTLTNVAYKGQNNNFTVSQNINGNITLDDGANRTIKIDSVTSGDGDNLSIVSGKAGVGGGDGGDLLLSAGDGQTAGGDVLIFAGSATADGSVYLGANNTSTFDWDVYVGTQALNDSTNLVATTAFVDRAITANTLDLSTSFLPHNTWLKALDNGGDTVNLLKFAYDKILFGADIGISSLSIEPDAGIITLASMDVTSGSAHGDTMALQMAIDGIIPWRMRGTADGAGGLVGDSLVMDINTDLVFNSTDILGADTIHANVFDGSDFVLGGTGSDITMNADTLFGNPVIDDAIWNGQAIADTYLTKSGDWTGTFDGQQGTYYLARANHTGTQTASTISDFDTEVSNNTDVAANTSARHSAVTASGSYDYITLVGQDIVRGQVDLTADVTGVLPDGNIAKGGDWTGTLDGIEGAGYAQLAAVAEHTEAISIVNGTAGNTVLYVRPNGSQSANIINVRNKANSASHFVIDALGMITLSAGTDINEFSTDGTLAGNSDDAVPTEKAVKTYVDGVAGGNPFDSLFVSYTSPHLRMFNSTYSHYTAVRGDNNTGSLVLSADEYQDANSSAVRFNIDGTEVARVDSAARIIMDQAATPASLASGEATIYADTDGYFKVHHKDGKVRQVGVVQYTDTTLTDTQVKALNSSPITLVAAPGAGYAIQVVSASLFLDYNSIAYITNTTVRLRTGANSQFRVTSGLDGTADRFCQFNAYTAAASPGTTNMYDNGALLLSAQTGNPASGNSPVSVYVTYIIIEI